MDVYALASGSSGNAYLIRTQSAALLLEAGLPAARLVGYLTGVGFDPQLLSAILLTHAHRDHSQGARELSDRYKVPIFATAGTLGHPSLHDSPLARPLAAGSVVEWADFEVRAFAVPHDCTEPVGFRVSGPGATVCLTTDLGFVPDGVRSNLLGADLLVLEANHDEEMLWVGPYPPSLKRRVGGAHGHLSNTAAAECLVGLASRPPRSVWLAHLSQVNNRAATALAAVREALEHVGLGQIEVAAAGRNRPSLSWSSESRERQLALF